MDFALRVVRCHRSLGDLDQCKLLMGKLIEQFPRNWEVMSEMGRLAWTRQDAAEAEKWWRRAVDLNPYDKQTLHDLYICLNQTKGPNDPAVRKVKEQFDRIARDYARFEDLMLRQLPANPNNPDIHYEIGSLFFRLGEEKSGAFWMQKTLALNPQHRAAHLTLASYLDKTGNKEQAENERRLASGMSPSAH
jgi:tetratricopeptide (TPR) repeat protein